MTIAISRNRILRPSSLMTRGSKRPRANCLNSPDAKKDRLMKEKGLDEYNAELIVSDKKFAAYFDEAAKSTEDAKSVANWMLGDVSAYLNANSVTIGEFPVSPTHLGEMVNLINKGVLSSKLCQESLCGNAQDRQSSGCPC